MSQNPYQAPVSSLKTKDPLPWHRRVVSGFIAIPGFLSLLPVFMYIFSRDLPMTTRLGFGLLFAAISVASFSAYFMLRKFHRFAWLPQVAVAVAIAGDCAYFWHGIASDSMVPLGFATLVSLCAIYSFINRNAKPRSPFSE